MKMYIIQRRHFEYNDESYESSGGGNAVRAYKTLKAANEAVIDMTVKDLKDGQFHYFYDVAVGDFSREATQLFESRGATFERDYLCYDDCEEIGGMLSRGKFTDAELRTIALGLPSWKALYFVEEVEVG